MDIFKICGVAVLCSVVGVVIGRAIGGIGVALRLAGLCLVLGGSLTAIAEISSESYALFGISGAAEYLSVMTKALGISLLCRICADVCRDCGEGTIASGVESAGKLSLVLLALPLVSRLSEYATDLAEELL